MALEFFGKVYPDGRELEAYEDRFNNPQYMAYLHSQVEQDNRKEDDTETKEDD